MRVKRYTRDEIAGFAGVASRRILDGGVARVFSENLAIALGLTTNIEINDFMGIFVRALDAPNQPKGK